MSYVFISYKRNPDRDFAEILVGKVREAGYETWQDISSLHAGESWRRDIDQAIRNAIALIVVITPESQNSEYVTYEWAFALGAGTKIIPILLRPVEKLHPRLEDLSYFNFTEDRRPWDDLLNHLRRVRENTDRQPNSTVRANSVVHYAQEVVLRAFGGEYVVLVEENGRKTLKACAKNIEEAQRFLVVDFNNPYGRPLWPVQYGSQIALRSVDDNRFVSACEDLTDIPLCVWGEMPRNWEKFTLKRPDSDEAQALDRTVRFRYAIQFQCHNGKWVWTNYYATGQPLEGNLATEPDTYENFNFEEPYQIE